MHWRSLYRCRPVVAHAPDGRARHLLPYTNPGKVPVELREAWAGVLEIAGTLDDVQYGLRALWGLWAFGSNAGRPEVLTLAKRFCDLATRSINPIDLATGDRMLGMTSQYLGDQAGAQTYLEPSFARLDPTVHRSSFDPLSI